MFALVDDIEAYPKFLPWCGGTEVTLRDAARTIATVKISYLGIRTAFTTENRKEPGLISIALRDGPFKEFTGSWRFTELETDACKIDFELTYQFASRTLDLVIGPVFNKITGTFVDAFVKEADKRYG